MTMRHRFAVCVIAMLGTGFALGFATSQAIEHRDTAYGHDGITFIRPQLAQESEETRGRIYCTNGGGIKVENIDFKINLSAFGSEDAVYEAIKRALCMRNSL
jgi:hypothetical protein